MIPPVPAPVRREIVRLRMVENLRYAEIAKRTGVSVSVISRILSPLGLGRPRSLYEQGDEHG